MLPTGLRLLALSKRNPEPYLEPYYRKNFLVITAPPQRSNDLMKANRDLLDLITAYAVAHARNEKRLCSGYIDDIARVLATAGMNYSEFASFWAVCDITYSIFKKMNIATQRALLRDLVEQYIELRHHVYGFHGYTATTLQVQADSFAHKHSGSLARTKIIDLLHKRGFSRLRAFTSRFAAPVPNKIFILPDGGDKTLFVRFLGDTKTRFAWSRRHDGKLPDFVIFSEPHTFIVEHKHMKEGGGGQDKQIVEIIDFVEQSEPKSMTHYVAFLDGAMANMLMADQRSSGKLSAQLRHIERALRLYPKNYFVNTAGFNALLDALPA
jgi:hypothetical protein